MTGRVLKFGAVLALLLAPGSAFADDPTGVLLQERGLAPKYDECNPWRSPTRSNIGASGTGSRPPANAQFLAAGQGRRATGGGDR
jgi:hypothetical protein